MPTIKYLNTKDEFKQFLHDNKDKLVVVDFTASWCGPCKRISPKVEELSEEFPSVAFVKVDVDENEETAAEYGVSAMPTFLFFKNQLKVDSMTGANETKLRELVEKYH